MRMMSLQVPVALAARTMAFAVKSTCAQACYQSSSPLDCHAWGQQFPTHTSASASVHEHEIHLVALHPQRCAHILEGLCSALRALLLIPLCLPQTPACMQAPCVLLCSLTGSQSPQLDHASTSKPPTISPEGQACCPAEQNPASARVSGA